MGMPSLIRRTCPFFVPPGPSAGRAVGHAHFSQAGVGCWASPWDMLIPCGEEWAGGQARGTWSFLRGTCSFFRPRAGHIGDMSRPWSVGRACPVTSDADTGHGPGQGTCSFFSQDILDCCATRLVGGPGAWACSFSCGMVRSRGEPVGHAHFLWRGVGWWASPRSMLIPAGGHAHFSGQGLDTWGICPGLGLWGGHVPWRTAVVCSTVQRQRGATVGRPHGWRPAAGDPAPG
jgi:hypothetical protein